MIYDEFQKFLSQSQALNNAQYVMDYLSTHDGWSKASICALLGNMYCESTINPHMYEYGYTWGQNRGYGLVQWTPRSKLSEWCKSQGLDYTKMNSQLKRIDYEVSHNIQWLSNGHHLRYGLANKYIFSFSDFRTNKPKLNLHDLTESFLWNYEGAGYQYGVKTLPKRVAFAKLCYDKLKYKGKSSGHYDTPTPSTPSGTGIPSTPNLLENIENTLKKMFTHNIYYTSDKYYHNDFFTIRKLHNNMYQVSPNINLTKTLENIVNDLTGNPSATNPQTPPPSIDTPTEHNKNELINKVVKKALSYKDDSLIYSMGDNGARDINRGRTDCSQFVMTCFRQAIPNFPDVTGNQYNYAVAHHCIVADVNYKNLDSLISKARQGDYVLMRHSAGAYSSGGAEHVGLMVTDKIFRHQSAYPDWRGPNSVNLGSYLKSLYYGRYTLCRPIK